MKKILVPLSTLGLAGAVAVGLVGATGSLSSAADPATPGTDQAIVKREDQVAELVLVSDDDDDDTNDADSGVSNTTVGTGSSISRADGTNSRYTAVSRDRDLSRGDKTKDWTQDGPGGATRDLTPNLTNDQSRNDTRR